jgi:hypothetical protein
MFEVEEIERALKLVTGVVSYKLDLSYLVEYGSSWNRFSRQGSPYPSSPSGYLPNNPLVS